MAVKRNNMAGSLKRNKKLTCNNYNIIILINEPKKIHRTLKRLTAILFFSEFIYRTNANVCYYSIYMCLFSL